MRESGIRWLRRLTSLLVGLLLLQVEPGAAQISAENFAKLGFNFSPPGARSTALGGAFIPLADDATAAETNPAGLTVLLYPQISFEFKGVEYIRELDAETGGGVEGKEFTDKVALPSFASLVLPLGSALRLAAFRHELVNYRNTVWTAGVDISGLGPDYGYLFPYTSELDLRVQNYGGAFALKMGPLSIGAAGGGSILDMDVDFTRYSVPRYERGFQANRLIMDSEDGGHGTGYFVNGGVLLRLGERASLGAVYRLRPKFEDLTFSFVDVDSVTEGEPDTVTVKIPDAIGAGLSFRPHNLVTFSFAGVLNKYSQLAENMNVAYYCNADIQPDPSDFKADDDFDLHAGMEVVLLMGGAPVGLRGGVARIAPSNTYYKPDAGNPTDPCLQQIWGTEPGDYDTQITAGLGTVLFRRLQFDVAALAGNDRREVIASVVFFFGRQ
ncbi:MAG: hypothetical protein HY705_09640 [Gemmatimonadetes bacterium]|nr:hypothetical protein [Gemmatimonadota bacterium]